jgi:hypothetical protein
MIEKGWPVDYLPILGSALGLGFLSGFRLYATVLTLGLAIRFGLFHPGPEMASLHVLADTKVLLAAGVIFALEFLAGKIMWLDSAWDAVHTFIRPLAAALVASTALGEFDPAARTIVALLAGGVAFTSHSTKAAARLAVNHIPEPFTNVAVSVLEDLAAPVGLWFVMAHPVAFLGALAVFLVFFAYIARWTWRMLRRRLAALRIWWRGALASRP